MQRHDIINQFLANQGWTNAQRVPIAGDASFRRYERIIRDSKTAILMDAPPLQEDIRPFIRVSGYLQDHGLSAPHIIASDRDNGLMLLEDLGDDLFARILGKTPEKEQELYRAAASVLIALYRHDNHSCNLPVFDRQRMMAQIALLTEWFIPLVSGSKAQRSLEKHYSAIWDGLIDQLPALKNVMVLYDFHAENLIWLPARTQSARVGLLDFQDAMLGSPVYDLVSILEDARRDVSAKTVKGTIDYYLSETGINHEDFAAAYALMAAQRNCRIVGTFARLSLRDHKPRYLSFLPRVWKHMEKDVSHPLLAPLKEWLDNHIVPEWRYNKDNENT